MREGENRGRKEWGKGRSKKGNVTEKILTLCSRPLLFGRWEEHGEISILCKTSSCLGSLIPRTWCLAYCWLFLMVTTEEMQGRLRLLWFCHAPSIQHFTVGLKKNVLLRVRCAYVIIPCSPVWMDTHTNAHVHVPMEAWGWHWVSSLITLCRWTFLCLTQSHLTVFSLPTGFTQPLIK